MLRCVRLHLQRHHLQHFTRAGCDGLWHDGPVKRIQGHALQALRLGHSAARDSLHESTPDVLARARSPDNTDMKQSSLGLSNTVKRTRKREFLDAMELVVPWAELVALIEPYAPESGRRGQQPFGGCAEFCVNGQSTASASRPVRKHDDVQEARSTRRIDGQPAGQLQEA